MPEYLASLAAVAVYSYASITLVNTAGQLMTRPLVGVKAVAVLLVVLLAT